MLTRRNKKLWHKYYENLYTRRNIHPLGQILFIKSAKYALEHKQTCKLSKHAIKFGRALGQTLINKLTLYHILHIVKTFNCVNPEVLGHSVLKCICLGCLYCLDFVNRASLKFCVSKTQYPLTYTLQEIKQKCAMCNCRCYCRGLHELCEVSNMLSPSIKNRKCNILWFCVLSRCRI